MSDRLADRSTSPQQSDGDDVQSDESSNKNNNENECYNSGSVSHNDDLNSDHKPNFGNESSEADNTNESRKQSCNNVDLKNGTEKYLEGIQTDTGNSESVCSEACDSNLSNQINNVIEDSDNETGKEVKENSQVDNKIDDEDVFADLSEDSGSDAEYESAEEGEEIHTDKQNLRELEETLTEEEKEERKCTAQAMKEEGNELFRCGSYKSAIRIYSRALRTCPLKYAKDRAIMYSNRSACKMRMEEFEDSIKDCTKALELHPHYMKALMRRAELYEKTEKLDEALADYQKILELDPSQHTARAACIKLPEQIKERNEKLKEEMMSKLKDLGNMVLRPFGLSTNNFQMRQDPNTGGYSVNFVQNPGQQ